MVKMRKLLSDKRKIRRLRRIFLNMNITFVSWTIECFGSIIWLLMQNYPQENRTTRGLQCILGVMYMIIIPCSYILNSADFKKMIIDNPIYLAFTNKFFPRINQVVPVHQRPNAELQNEDN